MRASYKRIHSALSGFLRFVLRIRVTGQENEPEPQALLLCSNHLSLIDPICICVSLTKTEPYYMAKKSLFKIPLIGLLIKAFNAYPVNRGGCDIGAIHKSIELLKKGNCVGIFPQGTRCKSKELENTAFKNGASLICTKAAVPILPVRIIIKNNRWIPFRRIDIVIGKMISFEEFDFSEKKTSELDRVSNIIFKKICDLSVGDDGK